MKTDSGDDRRRTSVIRALRDVGCDDKTIGRFLLLQEEGRDDESMCLLSKHRLQLLEKIHADQRQIDILDYLIYTVKKQKNLQRKSRAEI